MSATSYSAEFLGCKVSHTDLERLRERFADAGYVEVSEGAEVHVVNGCCVTGEAVAKTRQAVRRALADGAGAVLVTGCAARLPDAGFAAIDSRVRVIADPSERTPDAAVDVLEALGCRGGDRRSATPLRRRTYLKVQDGCSFPCAYCVIPEVRGPTRSRPVDAVLDEARRRVRQGLRELVVTGVNVGLYRDREAGLDLAGLLAALAEVDGLERVRLSSIEPDHLDDRLLDVLAAPPFLPHLHVPLQTGSDRLLSAMRRRYRAAGYRERIAAARARLPEVAVSADVIAGLPGETAADHGETIALIEDVRLARLHVFPYSPRPGTGTAAVDDVPPAVKRSRAAALRRLSDRLAVRHRRSLLGRVDLVLVERVEEESVGAGLGLDGTPWRLVGADPDPGAIVSAVAVGMLDDGRVDGRIAT